MNRTFTLIPDGDADIVALLEEYGIPAGTYTFLCSTVEGLSNEDAPAGFSDYSGTILTNDGREYDFWVEWDPVRERAYFSQIELVEPNT